MLFLEKADQTVILPFLAERGRKTYAVIFGFIAGVMPPMPLCGRSFLYFHNHYVAKRWASSVLLMMYWFSQIGPRTVRFLTVFRMVRSRVFVTHEKATLRTRLCRQLLEGSMQDHGLRELRAPDNNDAQGPRTSEPATLRKRCYISPSAGTVKFAAVPA
jgi:hypothetical protein